MRNRLVLSTAVLLLASTGVAGAQQDAAAKDAASSTNKSLEIGFRSSSVDGDKGRWERYRDLRDGATSKMEWSKESEKSEYSFRAANVGYHDQKYSFDYNQYGKLKLTATWNSIPLNYAYNTLTPWKYQGNNVWSLDKAARTSVENKVAGVLGIGSTAAQYNTASIFRALSTAFPMQVRRDVLNLGLKYRVNDFAGIDVAFTTTKKGGNQPYGASFAFNDGNELPIAVDNRTNDMTAGIELNKPKIGMIRAEWTGSWFKNKFQSLTWDNPLRATDYDNGKTLPAGPYDASAYSNGNGPAFGRLALPPSNSMNSFKVLALYKMPGHSTLSGQWSFTQMTQNEALIPWTTNPKIANAAVYAFFPDLARLPRATAEAEVRGINALLNYTTRPSDYFAFDMRYRYNDHENLSTPWLSNANVRFDGVPEAVVTETEHFNIRQNTVETGTTFTLPGYNTSLKLGYIFDDVKREGRSFGNMADYTFRVSLDAYGNQYGMVRGVFENTTRKGDGFSEASLEESGTQPGLRFYDEADTDRNKGTLIVQLTPSAKMDMNLSLAIGKDEYGGEGHELGLLDNSNASYNVSVNVYPSEKVTLGGSYGMEKISSMMRSRNANPLSGAVGAYESWTDPNRVWTMDIDETVKNAGLWVDLTNAVPNTDIRFSYDYSNSDQGFLHGGPRIQELSTNTALTAGDAKPCATGLTSCFIPNPNVTNSWTQMKVDLKHMFSPKLGLGVGMWYEKFDVTDFATPNLADGSPRMDPLGEISTGYGNRPYKGTTGMVRMIFTY